MTTARSNILSTGNSETLLRWITRSIEFLWLSAVILVPLAFLDRQYVVSEAVIAYVEVPKVALLRTLAGLISILLLLEWGIASRSKSFPPFWTNLRQISLRALFLKLQSWLRARPSHWIWLAVWFYFATYLMGTIFSASFSVSLWGEVPGQDGYSTYTIIAYVVLFGAIATHLKTKSQLWRLLGAIIVMGVLATGYSVLQKNGHDLFNLAEFTGGATTSQSTALMGNAIFAAAVMSMTIPISLFAAAASLRDKRGAGGDPERKWFEWITDPIGAMAWVSQQTIQLKRTWREWIPAYFIASAWVLVLTVQLMGITYTFSRGPWMGTILAITVTSGLAAVFAGWSALGRLALVLGVATGTALAVVQWDIPVTDFRLWLGAVLTMTGLIAIVAVVGWRIFGQASLALGVLAMIAAAIMLIPSWFSDGFEPVDNQSSTATESSSFGGMQAAERFTSIGGEISSGALGGRVDTWLRSWEVIRDRPWFEFDQLSLPWIRPLLGYGPDLFRYTYLLKSVPQGGTAPVEPDHAHNYFITHGVDLGVLGFLSSIGIFAAVFLVGGYLLIWQRSDVSPLLTLVLIGVLATLAGRFLEMMVGVARISDLTILWAVFGIFAALPRIVAQSAKEPDPPPSSRASRRRSRTSQRPPDSEFAMEWPSFIRLAIVAWLIGGIGILIWVKNVNYVRASVEVGEAVKDFRTGNFQASLSSLDKAIELAPDVSTYYNYRAQIYFAYHVYDQVTPESECSLQVDTRDGIPYGGCLNIKSFESNVESTNKRPFYYRSRWALANSALNLKQDGIAIQLYDEVLSMVPNSGPMQDSIGLIYVELGQAYLEAERPEAALKPLFKTNDFLPQGEFLAEAQFLQGTALRDLGRLSEAAESFELSLHQAFSVDSLGRAHIALAEIYGELDQTDLARKHRSSAEGIASEHLAQALAENHRLDFPKARESFELAVALSITDDILIRAHDRLIVIYQRMGDEDSSNKHQNLKRQLVQQVFQLGMNAQEQGEFQQAAADLLLSFGFIDDPDIKHQAQEALTKIFGQLGPSGVSELQLPARIHVELGQVFLDAKRPEVALEFVIKVNDSIADEVDLAEALFIRGSALQDLGRLSQAAESFELFLNNPTSPDSSARAHLALAEVYGESGQAVLAGEHRALVEKIASDRLAQAQGENQRLEFTNARESFELVVELSAVDDTLIQAHYALAGIYQRMGDEASSFKRKTLVRHLAKQIFDRGFSALDQGRIQQAAADLLLSFEFINIKSPGEMAQLFPSQDIEAVLQANEALSGIFAQIGPSTLSERHRDLALVAAHTLIETSKAQENVGQFQPAANSLESSLKLTDDPGLTRQAHGLLANIYVELGQAELAEQHRSLSQ